MRSCVTTIVCHTERIGDHNNPELIQCILNARIEAAGSKYGNPARVSSDDAEKLFQRFGTDIRGIESYLYDQIQTQVMRDGEVRFVD